MQRNLVLMAVMALAGWILMPFAGIVICTVCGIAVVIAFVSAYAIIADIEMKRFERYQAVKLPHEVKPEITQIEYDWRY